MSALNDAHLDSVVAIEASSGFDDDGKPTYTPLGSGVLVGIPIRPDELDEEVAEGFEALWGFLVTNWHVVEGKDEVFAKINAGGVAKRFRMAFRDENGRPLWHSHEDFDIAVTLVKAADLKEHDAEFVVIPEKHWLTLEQMREANVGLGSEVLVCGFPMGLSGTLKKFAIVRSGAIARLDDEIVAQSDCYLLDCLIFPGNSGGPVFDRPVPSGDDPPRLIGIVSGYLPYEDIAISEQTGKPRITFEENSGLAAVVPVDAIVGACAAIDAHQPDKGALGGGEGTNLASQPLTEEEA